VFDFHAHPVAATCWSIVFLVAVVFAILISTTLNHARILRNEAAESAMATLAGVIDEDTDEPEPDEDEYASDDDPQTATQPLSRPAKRSLSLPLDDPTELYAEADKAALARVSHNLVLAAPIGGRSWSWIGGVEPEDGYDVDTDDDLYPRDAVDPWQESNAIAAATVASLSNSHVAIPERTAQIVIAEPVSFNGFNAGRELARIKASFTDPALAAALIAHDPMMAFLLPVAADEPLPDFNEAATDWWAANRKDEKHDIDGNSISWSSGFTRAIENLRTHDERRSLEAAGGAR
jgi:hypothetical protein